MSRYRQCLIGAFLASCAMLVNVAFSEDWGAKESFAVVNPVARSEFSDVVSLAGDWDFVTDNAIVYRLSVGQGVWSAQAFPSDRARKIKVPGIWEAQGVGKPESGRTWDCVWDRGWWDLRNRYEGKALYRKIVAIPEKWQGKRVWLKVGGVSSNAFFWVDRKRAAFVDAYCGARKFDITDLVTPGKDAEIVALVRNDVPTRVGLAAVNERFGGFYRDVELEATPDVYVDDVWVKCDLATKRANVRVYVKGTDEKGAAFPLYRDELNPAESERLEEFGLLDDAKNGDSREIQGLASIEVVIKTTDGKVVASSVLNNPKLDAKKFPEPFVISVPTDKCAPWTPETPNLYFADVALKDADGKPIHGWTQRFGIRELKVVGNRFFLNGKPYFLRGGGDHNYDQINLIEPPDRDRFREHMAIYKAAGFNYMRHHTHSPLPEYFESAEEYGILLQPELPYYHDVPCDGFDFNPKREMWELFRTNRRYVSFATYSYGNEGFLGEPLDQEMYDWVRTNDPERLVLHQDGGVRNEPGRNSDFATSGPNGESTILPWTPGAFKDHKAPFIAHEYLNLAIKLDPRLEPRFTGVRTPPVNKQAWLDKLAKLGLDENWGAKCLLGAAKLQAIYQKRGLESARLDPDCDGYLFWSLVDASIPQGSCIAAQGYLNPFWEPREGGNSPQEFYRFNGPTSILIAPKESAPILVAGDALDLEVKISHFDAEPLSSGDLEWSFVDRKDGSTLASGKIPFAEIPAGFAGKIADATLAVPKDLDRARAVELKLAIAGSTIENRWNYWIFPKRVKPSLSGCVVSNALFETFKTLYDDVRPVKDATEDDVWIVSPLDSEFYDAIQQGRKIVAISPASGTPNVSLGWWALGTQVGAGIANDSAAFAGLPTDSVMDELWFRVVRVNAPDLTSRPLGDAFEPLFVGEGRDGYYLYAGQTKFKGAKILATYALDLVANLPETNAALDSLIEYAKSDKFDPKTTSSNIRARKFVAPDGVLWGFAKTLEKPESETMPWLTLYEDGVVVPTCRQLNDKDRVVWQTAKRDLSKLGDEIVVEFVGALGYWSERKTAGFELTLDGKTTFAFDIPERGDLKPGDVERWRSKDGAATLEFEIGRVNNPGPDYFGVFRVKAPKSAFDANAEASTLVVRSLGEGSRRWFSLGQYPGVLIEDTIHNK